MSLFPAATMLWTSYSSLKRPVVPCRFACTKGCEFSCSTAVSVWKKGHEVASHTVHHYDMRDMSYSQASPGRACVTAYMLALFTACMS